MRRPDVALCMADSNHRRTTERVSHQLTNEAGAAMPKGHPLSETAKDRIWDLRAQGLSEREIARQLKLGQNTVSHYLRALGGIRPRARRRPERALSLSEREEISRGIAGGRSARAIARALGRSHTTIGGEINRCGGRSRYRAHAADREAWKRSRRPRPRKLELCPELRRLIEERLCDDNSPRADRRLASSCLPRQ